MREISEKAATDKGPSRPVGDQAANVQALGGRPLLLDLGDGCRRCYGPIRTALWNRDTNEGPFCPCVLGPREDQ